MLLILCCSCRDEVPVVQLNESVVATGKTRSHAFLCALRELVKASGGTDSTNRTFPYGFRIHHGNIDHDLQEECVIEAIGTHYFFDDSASGWKFRSKVPCSSRWPLEEIDFHLDGFAGFASEMWGSGKGIRNCEYYQLSGDSLRLCFTINAEYGWSEFPWTGYYQRMESSSQSYLGAERVTVLHFTTYEMEYPGEDDRIAFSCTDTTMYEFAPDSNGHYAPYPRPEAFDGSYDSTVFNPVIAISKKVDAIRENGTVREKQLLKSAMPELADFF